MTNDTDSDSAEVELRDDGNLHVDKTPDGHQQQASKQASGEVFAEYGVIDTNGVFPSEHYEWQGEFPPEEVTPEHREKLAEEHDLDPDDNHAVASRCREDHVVVPVRVVRRGLKDNTEARSAAREMNEDHPYKRYLPVMLSDTRGL